MKAANLAVMVTSDTSRHIMKAVFAMLLQVASMQLQLHLFCPSFGRIRESFRVSVGYGHGVG